MWRRVQEWASPSPQPERARPSAPPPATPSTSTPAPRQPEPQPQPPRTWLEPPPRSRPWLLQRPPPAAVATRPRPPFEVPARPRSLLACERSADDMDVDPEAEEEEETSEDSPDRFQELVDSSGRTFYIDHHLRITLRALPSHRYQNELRRKTKYLREQVISKVVQGGDFSFCTLNVDRACLLDSACEVILRKSPQQLRRPPKVRFRGEEGIDAGGLSRELFYLFSTEVSRPEFALFKVSPGSNLLSLNPDSHVNELHLAYLRATGRMIGMAVLHGERMCSEFAGVIWKLLVGGLQITEPRSSAPSIDSRRRRRDSLSSSDSASIRSKRRRQTIDVDDLEGIDDPLVRSLNWVKDNDATDLCRTFVHEVESFGEMRTVLLHPQGEDLPVTEENKLAYVSALSRYLLIDSVKPQTEALLRGLYEIVPQELLSTLRPEELKLLICGISDIDVDDWEAHTRYINFQPNDPTIRLFWAHVRTLDPAQLTSLLQFSTATNRLPPGGFAYLKSTGFNPTIKLFTIVRDLTPSSQSELRLPSAHTCFNELVLPAYETPEGLARGLHFAVNMSHDFGGQ